MATEPSNLPINDTLEIRKDRFLTCPIHLETLVDPVQGPCGHVFCRKCIWSCLRIKELCPICQTKMNETQLYTTLIIRQILDEALTKNNKNQIRERINFLKQIKDWINHYKERALKNRWDLKFMIIIIGIIAYGFLIRINSNRNSKQFEFGLEFILWTILFYFFVNYIIKH